jgi:hypothetical protein
MLSISHLDGEGRLLVDEAPFPGIVNCIIVFHLTCKFTLFHILLTLLYLDAWHYLCSRGSGDGYYSSACVGSGFTVIADSIFIPVRTACPGASDPPIGHYVSSLCYDPGTFIRVGSPFQSKNVTYVLCSTPSFGSQYVTKVCTSGSNSTLGSDTEMSSCSNDIPRAGDRWISVLCKPGDYNELGSDIVTRKCTVPDMSRYEIITTPCDPGTLTKEGHDAVIDIECLIGTIPSNNGTKCDDCKDNKTTTRRSKYCNVCKVDLHVNLYQTTFFTTSTYTGLFMNFSRRTSTTVFFHRPCII